MDLTDNQGDERVRSNKQESERERENVWPATKEKKGRKGEVEVKVKRRKGEREKEKESKANDRKGKERGSQEMLASRLAGCTSFVPKQCVVIALVVAAICTNF